MQTLHPHIYLYLGLNYFTLIEIIYCKPITLTNHVFPFQTLLRPPSFSNLIKSLYNSLIDICIKYLPTLLVFLLSILSQTNIDLLQIWDAITDVYLIIHSWIITFNESLINEKKTKMSILSLFYVMIYLAQRKLRSWTKKERNIY